MYTLLLRNLLVLQWLVNTVLADDGSKTSASLNDNTHTLVKIGGSSITDKARREALNQSALHWFAQSLTSSRHRHHNRTFVVVHGAGSFGHHTANEYGLGSNGVAMSARVGQGLAATRLSVQTLNRHVVQTLLASGIPAVGISPCFGGVHGESWGLLERIVKDTVASGLVPVLHGDACLSPDNQRAVILGGDALMEHFGILDWTSRAIFITDVDGIFTADPRHDESAELVRSIEIDAHGQLLQSTVTIKATGSSHAHDVTGGLEAKLAAAVTIAKSGTEVVIVKCGSRSAEAVLSGSTDYEFGTEVKLSA